MASNLFVAGSIPSNGASIVANPTWDLASGAPGWRPGRWVLVEIGWIPTNTDTPIFRLGAGAVSSPVYILPSAGAAGAKVSQDVWWELPETWDGRIQWLPGGPIFAGADGAPSQQGWLGVQGVVLWLQFALLEDEPAPVGCQS